MRVSNQVRHKPACIVTENSLKLEILDLEKVLYYLWRENKGADQLCSYCTADLQLCFPIYADCWLSGAAAHSIEKKNHNVHLNLMEEATHPNSGRSVPNLTWSS